MQYETAIVILHYINEKLTRDCISSIRENTDPEMYHIYVVDNNSPQPLSMLQSEDISIIRNDKRHSISGMNKGFHYALYQSTISHKYVVNLDNDTIVHAGWLEALVKEMEEHPTTGICGGKQWGKEVIEFHSVGSD